jgi:hypothetical protein
MNDLHDALRMAISDYMNFPILPMRTQQKMKDVYGKFTYNYETVDSLIEFEEELEQIEEELEMIDEEE